MSEVTFYGFAVDRANGDVDAVIVDGAGKFIGGQVCSSVGWAVSDLNHHPSQHSWFMSTAAKGQPYSLVWLEHPPRNWDGVREHTDATLAPWHIDPANNSGLRDRFLEVK